MPVVVASAGGNGSAGRASSHRSSRPGARRRRASPPDSPPGLPWMRLAGSVVGWGALLSATIGLTLVARRLSGALAPPATVGALVAATAIAIGLVASADRVRPRWFAARFAARLGLALAMAALCPPSFVRGGSLLGTLGTIGCLAAGTAALLQPLRDGRSRLPPPTSRRKRGRRLRGVRPSEPTARDAAHPAASPPRRSPTEGAIKVPDPSPPAATSAPAPVRFSPPPPEPGTLVLQRFERVLEAGERGESVRGTILLRVAAGSRSAIGHVGFCPPFSQVPRVEAGTACEEVEATVVAAEVLPWGVRVECRLDEAADESIDVPVDIVARSPVAADPSDAAPA